MKRLWMVSAAVIACIVMAGCVSSPDAQADRARERALNALKPVKTTAAQRPSWIDKMPHSKTELAFVGISQGVAREKLAKNEARQDAMTQLVKYYGTLISAKGRTAQVSYGISSDVLDPQQVSQELQEYVAENLAQKLSEHESYVETFLKTSMEQEHIAYVLMKIDRSFADRAMKDYCDNKADEARRQAAAEKDAEKRKQLEKAADFFGGYLKSSLTE